MTDANVGPPVGPVLSPSRSSLSRRTLVGLFALGAGALIALSAFAPWVSGPDADIVNFGISTGIGGVGSMGSRAGWAGGDGLVFVIIGVLTALVGAMTLANWQRRWHRPVLVVGAISTVLWAWLDAAELGAIPKPDGSTLDLHSGIGPAIAVIGALFGVVAAVGLKRNPLVQSKRAADLAARLDVRGKDRDSLEIRQRNLRVALDHQDDKSYEVGDLEDIFHDVCSDQAVHGYDELARANTRLLITWVEQRYQDAPDELMSGRIAIADLLVRTDPGYATAYVEWLWSDAVERYPQDDPALAVINERCSRLRTLISTTTQPGSF